MRLLSAAPRQHAYLDIDDLIELIDEPQAGACRTIMAAHARRFAAAPGSGHNHQTWAGGYLDHLRETMNLAVELHAALDTLRPLPFTRSDALLVLFLHDLEKPWRHMATDVGVGADDADPGALETKQAQQAFRLEVVRRHGMELTPEHVAAIDFVDGEGGRYSPERRGMNELAAFCHACDTLSARLWHDRPRADADEWGWRGAPPAAR